jgi:beta-N-acetylhexosaminidase
MNLLVQALKIAFACTLFLLAAYVRTPFLAAFRDWIFLGIIILSLSILAIELPKLRKKDFLAFLTALIAGASLLTTLTLQAKHEWIKHSVLTADAYRLEKLGQHFVVGYRDFDAVRQLVEKRAIAGIFITARNAEQKTKSQLNQEIQTLQEIRRQQNLSPLWIATDQEGGIVSRLSPPLSHLPQLSKLIEGETLIERKRDHILQYGRTQGKELVDLGVNLNFAPVVDLNKGINNPNDKFSQIYKRAISSDKNIVATVAQWYCQALKESGVQCTLKHFPGLGRVKTDTHIDHAELTVATDELMKEDWVPFRTLMQESSAFVMLSHAKLMSIDPQHPTSFSEAIANQLIRKAWKYDGILITDDFCMQAVFGSADGIENATVKALNASVDLILISYDHDLYYESMNAVLNAEVNHQLDQQQLNMSHDRLLRFVRQ